MNREDGQAVFAGVTAQHRPQGADQERNYGVGIPICFLRRATRAAFSGGGGSRRIRSVNSRLRSSQ